MISESLTIQEEIEYPFFEHTTAGIKVWISPRSALPGVYLNFIAAKKAINLYDGKSAEARVAREEKKRVKAEKAKK